ncbi:MAG: glutamyl-tRNA reductase [Candidatus Promineifilaceae bacterium]
MKLICVGTDHHSTAVAVREKLTFSQSHLQEFLGTFQSASPVSGCSELAVLATCNRVEMFAAVESDEATGRLVDYWAGAVGLDSAEIIPHLNQHADDAVPQHLFRVAAGLDSIVIGEPQILGQVTQAFELANRLHCTGPQLRSLFRTAIRVGKRARTETGISRNAASISSVAVKLAQSKLGSLADKRVALVGTGKMGVLALKSLKSHRVQHIDIINRSRSSAVALAKEYKGQAYGFENLQVVMQQADVVISATGAPHTIIDFDFMQDVMAQRDSDLVLIDIAVPRDVDQAVHQIEGVHLFDVDSLRGALDGNLQQRQKAIPAIEAIISEESAALEKKQRELAVRPTIHDLRSRAEEIRQRELARALRQLPDADEATRKQFERFSQSLINKILHNPTLKLREEANKGNGQVLESVTRKLFDL